MALLPTDPHVSPFSSRAWPALTVVALATLLAGCIGTGHNAPRAQRLDDQALATDAAIQAAAGQAAWPERQWWRAYGDPQLDAWIGSALADNPRLATAAARVRRAESLAGLAESREALQVEGKGAFKRYSWPTDGFYGPGELADRTTWNNNAELGLSYALDFWGRERDASAQALDQAHQAAAEVRAAELELTGNIVRSYIGFALHHDQRDILAATLEQQRQLADLAQRQLDGGLGTQFEVSQARALLPETERQLEALDETLALDRNQLAALAGKGPGAGARLQRPRLTLGAAPRLPSSLPLELVGKRPDVVARRWQIAAAAKGVDVARASFYPNIDLVANVGQFLTLGRLSEMLTHAKTGSFIGPAFSLPIYDGGALRSRLGAESAAYDMAVSAYNQTLVDALKDISDALIKADSAARQATLADQASQEAQRTYDIAREAFRRGLTDYLHVLDAQTRLFAQQRVTAQVHALRLAAQAAALVALGGGADLERGPGDHDLVPAHVAVERAPR